MKDDEMDSPWTANGTTAMPTMRISIQLEWDGKYFVGPATGGGSSAAGEQKWSGAMMAPTWSTTR